ncbi:MAG: hypothetical protein A2189_01475 [Paenibacillus sp. RIFOXYA1_FULL_44_5]|nr:MAG: hypothetical protein A2189_01475 [Paenibacillus sp. RIFOXYA1_FULL_44_5]
MKTSIVIATFNKLDYTKQCIESIRQYTAAGSYEIIVVDNHSTDGSLDWLKAQPDIRFIANENNLGFPIACNQGMEIAVGDNILLLNNDTIVTARWLDNLLKCLYSREEIGAVGPITNYSINEQAVPVTYKTMDEMHQFADRCNQSNSSEWEERLTLVGFCVVFKKPVIDKIGLLDERFSPGNYEDDDYSYRIRQAGFEMMLCKDTYIHHYGSTSFRDNVAQYTKLLQTNQAKFIEKWGFDPEVSRLVHTELLDLMSLPEGGPFKVLELGCGSGGTLLRFKTRYPYAKCYGMEFNPNMAAFASLVADVHVGGLQDVGSKFAEGFFDAVILGETFLQSHSFIQALQTIKPLLKDNGELLASIPHLQHYSIVRNMINGTISREQMHAVTLSEMDGGFKQVGFSNVYITKYKLPMPEQEKQWLQQLRKMASTDLHEFWEVKTFFVRAKATARSSRVGKMVEQLLNDQDK